MAVRLQGSHLLGQSNASSPEDLWGFAACSYISGSGFTCCLVSHSSLSGYLPAFPCLRSVWTLLSSWQNARLWEIHQFLRSGGVGSFWHRITSAPLQDTADFHLSVYNQPGNATSWRYTGTWDKLSLHIHWIFSPFLSLFPFMKQLHESNKHLNMHPSPTSFVYSQSCDGREATWLYSHTVYTISTSTLDQCWLHQVMVYRFTVPQWNWQMWRIHSWVSLYWAACRSVILSQLGSNLVPE